MVFALICLPGAWGKAGIFFNHRTQYHLIEAVSWISRHRTQLSLYITVKIYDVVRAVQAFDLWPLWWCKGLSESFSKTSSTEEAHLLGGP